MDNSRYISLQYINGDNYEKIQCFKYEEMMGLLTYIKLSGNYSTETLNELKEAKEKELCLIGESFLNDLVSYYNFTDIRDAIDKIVKGDIVSKNISAVFAKVSGRLSSETSSKSQNLIATSTSSETSLPPATSTSSETSKVEELVPAKNKKKFEYDYEDDDEEIGKAINTASGVAKKAIKELREAIKEEEAKKKEAKKK